MCAKTAAGRRCLVPSTAATAAGVAVRRTGVGVLLCTLALFLGTLSPAVAAPDDGRATTDRLLFDTSMHDFLGHRAAQYGGRSLDWSTDECSAPFPEPHRSQPRGYDFRPACTRHDFGYANYLLQARLTEDARQRIDDRFHRDMHDVCGQYSGWREAWRGVECRAVADQYYFWVRSCGQNPAPYCPQRGPATVLRFLRELL